MGEGLFRAEVKGRRKRDELSPELRARLGVKNLKRMNPRAKTPEMAPAGPDHPDLYVLGWAPTAEDDADGVPFSTGSDRGRVLRRALNDDARTGCRFSHVVRTRPPGDRQPKRYEVDGFTPTAVADIEASNPPAILAVGRQAISWATGTDITMEKIGRGRRFKARIGDWTGWVYTAMDPELIARIKGSGRYLEIDGAEWFRFFRRDVADALHHHEPRPYVPPTDLVSLRKPVQLVKERDAERVIAHLEQLAEQPVLTFDFETNALRPYGRDARCLTIAVGTAQQALAFAFDHPDTPYHPQEREAILRAFRALLVGAERVTAHNLAFELEWLAHIFDDHGAMKMCRWDDTMVQAYVLDERIGALNLHWLCAQYLGVPLKSLTDVDSRHAMSTPLPKLLLYNALDVVFTDRLAVALEAELERADLFDVYDMAVRRVPSVTLCQRLGVPVDQEMNRVFQEDFDGRLRGLLKLLRQTDGVKEYEREHGAYNPGSNPCNVVLFRDVLGAKHGGTDKGGYSVDADHLGLMRGKKIEEIRPTLLEWREIAKLGGTYVDKLDAKHRQTLVYPDGRLHCSFSTCVTATARLSSSDPNMQNFPKRKHKEVRRQIVAPPGQTFLSCDYGQIEHRCVAIVSNDRAMIRALIEGYDVHLKYAQRAAELEAAWFAKRHDENIKGCRSSMKNQFVFPTIYGSGDRGIAAGTGLKRRTVKILLDEFWKEHAGVRRWQKIIRAFYDKYGFVRSLTGRIRRGPLNHNMILNTPIQGLASDIVVNAQDRIVDIAAERDEWFLAPVLNIHDDLTFLVPDEQLAYAAEIIIETMLAVPYDFINVPILVEAEVGKNWGEMTSIGEFSSYDVAA